jgi:O-antigen ligase
MELALANKLIDRARLTRIADWLVVGVAVSMPWSTSATGILVALWLIAVLPTLDLAELRRTVAHPAGGLPVALFAFAVIGMLWADAPWGDRVSGLESFAKLLVIPLVLVQFRRSDQGLRVALGFLLSCTLLLAVSWLVWRFPFLPGGNRRGLAGVPVKDYIVQSGEFLLCAFALTHLALSAWTRQRRLVAVALFGLALLFVANLVFVISSRTSLVVFPVMLAVLAAQRLSLKGSVTLLLAAAVLTAAAWASSPFLRYRALLAIEEVTRYQKENAETSSGYRLEFWKKSIEFAAQAPIIGNGTGSTHSLFRRAATGTGITAAYTDNPHNQTLIIAVQLGLIGVAILYAMWLAHALLFRGPDWPCWIGLGIVAQTVVSALFNSQLFYFTPGWIYVFGVGVLGGMVLAHEAAGSPARPHGAGP